MVPCPLRGRGPARRTKVGGEAAPFPLRHPFRFHVRRFPNVSALGSLPHPRPSGLSPAAPTGERAEAAQSPPAGVDGKAGPQRRRGGSGGRGGGGGALPPNGPRREAPNLYRRPLAHTNPDVAAGASGRHVRRSPAPPPHWPPVAAALLGAYGAMHPGSCSSPGKPDRRSGPRGGRRGGTKAGQRRVGARGRTNGFITIDPLLSVIESQAGVALSLLTHAQALGAPVTPVRETEARSAGGCGRLAPARECACQATWAWLCRGLAQGTRDSWGLRGRQDRSEPPVCPFHVHQPLSYTDFSAGPPTQFSAGALVTSGLTSPCCGGCLVPCKLVQPGPHPPEVNRAPSTTP